MIQVCLCHTILYVTGNVVKALMLLTGDEESADEKQVDPEELRVGQICTNLKEKQQQQHTYMLFIGNTLITYSCTYETKL